MTSDCSDVATNDELLKRFTAMSDELLGQRLSREGVMSVFQDCAEQCYDGSVEALMEDLKAVTADEDASMDLKVTARSLECIHLSVTGSIAELGEFVAAVHSVLPSMMRSLVERN